MARMEIIHNWTNGGILGKEDPKKSWETQRKQLPNPTNVLEDLPLPPHCLTNTLSDYWEMSRKESLDNHVASDQNTQEWRTRHYFPSIEDDSFGIICYRKDERWKERERKKKREWQSPVALLPTRPIVKHRVLLHPLHPPIHLVLPLYRMWQCNPPTPDSFQCNTTIPRSAIGNWIRFYL